MTSRSFSPLALACLLALLVQDSTASFRFSDIQLVVGFSSGCTTAYQSSISNCNLNDLAGIGGSGSCSSTCQSSIRTAQSSVQRACSRETADLNSLIGKIFVGEAVDFLCVPVVQTLLTTTTVAPARTTAASTNTVTTATRSGTTATGSGTTAAASAASSSNSQPAGSSTDRGTTTTDTSSSSLFPSSTSDESDDTSTASSTSFSSISTSTTTTSSSVASTTTARSTGSGTNAGGGGSPFDNIGSNAASHSKALQPHFFVLSLILTSLVFL